MNDAPNMEIAITPDGRMFTYWLTGIGAYPQLPHLVLKDGYHARLSMGVCCGRITVYTGDVRNKPRHDIEEYDTLFEAFGVIASNDYPLPSAQLITRWISHAIACLQSRHRPVGQLEAVLQQLRAAL